MWKRTVAFSERLFFNIHLLVPWESGGFFLMFLSYEACRFQPCNSNENFLCLLLLRVGMSWMYQKDAVCVDNDLSWMCVYHDSFLWTAFLWTDQCLQNGKHPCLVLKKKQIQAEGVFQWVFSVSGVRRGKSIKGLVFYCNSHEMRAEGRVGNAGK